MKKLLLSVIFIAATASAQSTNICVNSTGDSRAPLCDANNYLDVAVMSVIPGTSATSLGKAEDAMHTNGDIGVVALVQRADTIGPSTSANGDYALLNISSQGGLRIDPIGQTARVCVAITPDTSAYAANDIVGGKLTFASAFRANVNSGLLQSIEVTNTEIDGIAFNFCLFNADPSGSTVADQGAATIVAADLQKLIGCYAVSDGTAFAATELYQSKNVNQAVDAAATSVYGILRTTGAPTWAAAQTVNVCIDILQD